MPPVLLHQIPQQSQSRGEDAEGAAFIFINQPAIPIGIGMKNRREPTLAVGRTWGCKLLLGAHKG